MVPLAAYHAHSLADSYGGHVKPIMNRCRVADDVLSFAQKKTLLEAACELVGLCGWRESQMAQACLFCLHATHSCFSASFRPQHDGQRGRGRRGGSQGMVPTRRRRESPAPRGCVICWAYPVPSGRDGGWAGVVAHPRQYPRERRCLFGPAWVPGRCSAWPSPTVVPRHEPAKGRRAAMPAVHGVADEACEARRPCLPFQEAAGRGQRQGSGARTSVATRQTADRTAPHAWRWRTVRYVCAGVAGWGASAAGYI